MNTFTSTPSDLGDTARRAYAHLLERGAATPESVRAALGVSQRQVQEALAELTDHRLATAEAAGGIRAVSPYTAAAELIGPEEGRLRRRLDALERARARLEALGPVYEQAHRRRRAPDAVEVVGPHDRVARLVADAAARCTEEVLTARPVGHPGCRRPGSEAARDLELLERGVRLRVLYQHTARHSREAQRYAEEVGGAGAEIRTLGGLFGRLLVFDGAAAFLPVPDDPEATAVVREPSVVAFLAAVFGHLWHMAEPFAPSYSKATESCLREAVVRWLVSGAKDEVIARKLGMSLRTCRRRVSELMEELGATSRFQAGFLLARQAAAGPVEAPPHTAAGPSSAAPPVSEGAPAAAQAPRLATGTPPAGAGSLPDAGTPPPLGPR
ncbi:LuxR family transcriptional regulator [Streptomyces sp. CC228A]|uniref:LuxR family transcriptional regulator n=1 Tax=Streptomyces sp. CC228A TaxID=2898186 RepID=UPI001F18D809|nr:LuxR family transcriptional regulator [Streptomyces sp. CC228A]